MSSFSMEINTTTLVCHLSNIFSIQLTLAKFHYHTVSYSFPNRYHLCAYLRGSSCLSWFHCFYCCRRLFPSNLINGSLHHISFCRVISAIFFIHVLLHVIFLHSFWSSTQKHNSPSFFLNFTSYKKLCGFLHKLLIRFQLFS